MNKNLEIYLERAISKSHPTPSDEKSICIIIQLYTSWLQEFLDRKAGKFIEDIVNKEVNNMFDEVKKNVQGKTDET